MTPPPTRTAAPLIYYGVDRRCQAEVAPRCMVSVRTMARRRIPIVPPGTPWLMDSGAFTYLTREGSFPLGPKAYGDLAERWKPDGWFTQDWPCEPMVVKATGLSVREHMERTVDSAMALKDRGAWTVVQGWTLADYLWCLDRLREQGCLTPTLGVGSTCRRHAGREVLALLRALKKEVPGGTRLHAFGVKTSILSMLGGWVGFDSADTFAWAARQRWAEHDAGHKGRTKVNLPETLARFVARMERRREAIARQSSLGEVPS